MDGWIDGCGCPINAKGPYAAQTRKEITKKRRKCGEICESDGDEKKIRWR